MNEEMAMSMGETFSYGGGGEAPEQVAGKIELQPAATAAGAGIVVI
jgi:hypothetical protein